MDLVILGILRTICRTSEEIKHSRVTKKGKRQKFRANFMFRGSTVCKSLFLFVHCISPKRFKRLRRNFKDSGLQMKVHGNCFRKPANATNDEQIAEIVTFLNEYFGLEFENTREECKVDHLAQFFSRKTNRIRIYKEYKDTLQMRGETPVSFTTFRRIWIQHFPTLRIPS